MKNKNTQDIKTTIHTIPNIQITIYTPRPKGGAV